MGRRPREGEHGRVSPGLRVLHRDRDCDARVPPVALDGIRFEDVVALGGPDGAAIAPTAVEQAKGAGHHREAVLAFPPLPAGAREVRITVRNVGGVGEWHFKWELPIGR